MRASRGIDFSSFPARDARLMPLQKPTHHHVSLEMSRATSLYHAPSVDCVMRLVTAAKNRAFSSSKESGLGVGVATDRYSWEGVPEEAAVDSPPGDKTVLTVNG